MGTTAALARLLRYPHAAVFDRAPGAELAFILGQAASDVAWTVADRQMVVTTGAESRLYNLPDHTINTLAQALIADGFDVSGITATHQHLSALALIDGSGSAAASNGNHVYLYTSLLWVILSAYAAEIADAETQVAEALRQMVISTSEGEWLDLWGTLYSVPRLQDESDADFRARIPREAFRLRVNARAIELAIRDATGYDVRIEEPWEEMFTLDQSLLSGPDKFYDGELTGPHLIRPRAFGVVDWTRVFEVINRNRAAGVLIAGSKMLIRSHIVTGSPAAIHAALTERRVTLVVYEDRALYDYSNIEDPSVPNHPFRRLTKYKFSSGAALSRTWNYWPDVTWEDQGDMTWASMQDHIHSGHETVPV